MKCGDNAVTFAGWCNVQTEHRVAIVEHEDDNQLAPSHSLRNDTIKIANVSYIEQLTSIVRVFMPVEINISPAVDSASSWLPCNAMFSADTMVGIRQIAVRVHKLTQRAGKNCCNCKVKSWWQIISICNAASLHIVLVVYTCSRGRSKHDIYLPHFRHFGMQVSFVHTKVCNLLFPEIAMQAFLARSQGGSIVL